MEQITTVGIDLAKNARDAVAMLQGVPNPVPSASAEESATEQTA